MTLQSYRITAVPKVTVIITAYNLGSFVGQAVESVMHQTFEEWELLVINDGSVDHTPQVVMPYTVADSRIRLINCKNGGVCRARDLGAELALAPHILFLDGDDFLEPSCLEILNKELDSNPDAIGAYGLPKAVDELDRVICDDLNNAFGAVRVKVCGGKHVALKDSEPTTLATMCIWDFICTPGQVMIRKSAFEKTGGHYNEIPHSEDWDLWIRLCLLGDFVYVRKFVMTKRERKTSRSKHWPSMALAEPIIRQRLASKLLMSAEQRHIARSAHRYSCLYKLGWAKSSLKSDGLMESLKQVFRACRSYIGYLRTHYDFKNVVESSSQADEFLMEVA